MHAPSKVKGRFLSTASLLGMVGPGDSVNNVLASKNAFFCGGGYWATSLQPGQSFGSNYKIYNWLMLIACCQTLSTEAL